MFELSLAADWKNAGSEVEIGEPDIKLRTPAAGFQTECKRPFSENSVRKNIADAASQLGGELDKPGNENNYGIVAISLTRVFTKGNLGCYAPAGMGKQVINEALADILDENTQQWRLKRFREMHPRIVAVMFHLSVSLHRKSRNSGHDGTRTRDLLRDRAATNRKLLKSNGVGRHIWQK
jgi:hypothetical protein